MERGDWETAKDWIRAVRDLKDHPREENLEASKMGRMQREIGAKAENYDMKAMVFIMESVGLDRGLVRSWRSREAASIVRGADYQVDHPSYPLLVQRKHRAKVSVKKTWMEVTGAWHARHHYIRVCHITWSGRADPAGAMDLAVLDCANAEVLHGRDFSPYPFTWMDDSAHIYDLEVVAVRRLWERACLAASGRDLVPSFLVRIQDVDVPLCLYSWDDFLKDYAAAVKSAVAIAG